MKRKKKFKKKPIIILFLLLIIILICLFLFWKTHNNEKKVTNNFQYSKETQKLIKEKLTSKEIENLEDNKDLELFIKEKYYLHQNLDLYISYYATHPEAKISDVIAIVNVTQNKEGYENPSSADLNKENYILVNKYNVLDKNYEPEDMVDISLAYAYEGRKIKKEVNEAFIKMREDALKEGIDLFVASAYRSYQYQENLYNNYTAMYGSDYTNTVSAKPGFSEHQTGLALDIIEKGGQMSEFENSKAYPWLKENAYKYGFILRYPKDKTYLTGYAFESWHYRFLGEDLAKKVYDEGITYDEYYAFYLAK